MVGDIFILQLYQFHLILSGIRSQRLGPLIQRITHTYYNYNEDRMGQKYLLKYRKVKLNERSSTVLNVNSYRKKYLRHGASQGSTEGEVLQDG